jgi:hypothetical protein
MMSVWELFGAYRTIQSDLQDLLQQVEVHNRAHRENERVLRLTAPIKDLRVAIEASDRRLDALQALLNRCPYERAALRAWADTNDYEQVVRDAGDLGMGCVLDYSERGKNPGEHLVNTMLTEIHREAERNKELQQTQSTRISTISRDRGAAEREKYDPRRSYGVSDTSRLPAWKRHQLQLTQPGIS